MRRVTAAAAAIIAAAGISAAIPSSASTTVPKGCVKTATFNARIHLGMTPKQVTKALGSKGSYYAQKVNEDKYGNRTVTQVTRRWLECKPGPAENNRVAIVVYRGGVVAAYGMPKVGAR